MKIFDLFKRKTEKPKSPTEWFLYSRGKITDGLALQNDFVDEKNKKCALESFQAFGPNTAENIRLGNKNGMLFSMVEFDDRDMYCAWIGDHRVDACGRYIASVLGVVLDKRDATVYKFEDFKAEIKQKKANIVQKYPTAFDLAYQFPIKFSSLAHISTNDKNIPNRTSPLFGRDYYPELHDGKGGK